MSGSFASILSWLALAIWASEDKIRGRYGAQGVSGYLVWIATINSSIVCRNRAPSFCSSRPRGERTRLSSDVFLPRYRPVASLKATAASSSHPPPTLLSFFLPSTLNHSKSHTACIYSNDRLPSRKHALQLLICGVTLMLSLPTPPPPAFSPEYVL